MSRLTTLIVVAVALIGCATVVSAARNHIWKATSSKPHPDNVRKLVISIKQRNVHQLERLVYEVSDPKSSFYGQYLSQDEVTALVSPTKESFDTVWSWLESTGAFQMDTVAHRDVIVALYKCSDLERAFGVKLGVFEHPTMGTKIVRTTADYTMPASVSRHVDLVQGINDFPLPRARRARDIQYPKRSTPAMQHMGATADAAMPGSSMFSMAMSPGKEEVMAMFSPVCLDGSVATSMPPCGKAGALTAVTVTGEPMYNSMAPVANVTADPMCNVNSKTNTVDCTAAFPAVYYTNYNVSLVLSFGGKMGPRTHFEFPVVSVPVVTPQTLATLYNIPDDIYMTNGTQSVGEFEQQYYDPTDLDLFFGGMGIRGAETPVTVVGPNIVSDDGGEANLDIQYIMGVARGIPTTFWSIKANSTIEIDDILKWGYQVSNSSNPPQINSLSYGMTEAHVDEYQGKGYLNRSDVEFMKMALRGITIIIADGDTGAGDLGPPPMSELECKTLHPDWPSQSPYVTAVASTYITPLAEPICYQDGGADCSKQPLGEVTVSLDSGLFWTSGGGFSDVTTMPSYQEKFVQAYLKQTDKIPPANMFNAKGRAYPDVVAVGHNLEISWNRKFMPIDGTSASAPIFAGVVSLVNSQRVSHSMPPLGFLGPLLYTTAEENPSAFHDITVGDNKCGAQGFTPLCCSSGYKAAIGWDGASGLGSPNYPELLRSALEYGAHAAKNPRRPTLAL